MELSRRSFLFCAAAAAAVWKVAPVEKQWTITTHKVRVVGRYRYDIATGKMTEIT